MNSRIQLGIDGKPLIAKPNGIARYTYNIINKIISTNNKQIDLRIYMPKGKCYWKGLGKYTSSTKYQLPGRFGTAIWSFLILPIRLWREKIDVFWGPSHRLPLFLRKRTKAVVTIHDLVWKHAGDTMKPVTKFLERALMPRAVKRANFIIADSRATADALIEVFPTASSKTRVVHLGCTKFPEPYGIERLRELGIIGDYALFVGTLEPRKNLVRLLSAYASLDKDLSGQVSLLIAGGRGWGRLRLGELIEDLGIGRNVRVLGSLDDRLLATVYANASFLCFPSLYEGFGLPLVEAMSFGVPSLTSLTSSMPEIAGDTAVYVDPLSVSSIADGLRLLIRDRVLRQELAERASCRARLFDWDTAAGKTIEVLAEAALGGRDGTRR